MINFFQSILFLLGFIIWLLFFSGGIVETKTIETKTIRRPWQKKFRRSVQNSLHAIPPSRRILDVASFYPTIWFLIRLSRLIFTQHMIDCSSVQGARGQLKQLDTLITRFRAKELFPIF